MTSERRRLLELYTAGMVGAVLPLTRTRTGFATLMADPQTVALAEEMKRDHPDLAQQMRTAAVQRRGQLEREATAGFVDRLTTSDAA